MPSLRERLLCPQRTALPNKIGDWCPGYMSDTKPALILHLATGGEPLVFALATEDVDELAKKLPLLLEHGSVESVQTKEDTKVSVNFAHVAAAYIDDLQRKGKVFGLH
jgi:hypothetical protein